VVKNLKRRIKEKKEESNYIAVKSVFMILPIRKGTILLFADVVAKNFQMVRKIKSIAVECAMCNVMNIIKKIQKL